MRKDIFLFDTFESYAAGLNIEKKEDIGVIRVQIYNIKILGHIQVFTLHVLN